jgi:hypothetical protein
LKLKFFDKIYVKKVAMEPETGTEKFSEVNETQSS